MTKEEEQKNILALYIACNSIQCQDAKHIKIQNDGTHFVSGLKFLSYTSGIEKSGVIK